MPSATLVGFRAASYSAAVADSLTPSALVADPALAIPLPNRTVYRPSNSAAVSRFTHLRTALGGAIAKPVAIHWRGRGMDLFGARASHGTELRDRA